MKPLVRSIVPLLAGMLASAPAVAVKEADCVNYRDNQRLDGRELQFCEALSLKQRYLKGVNFVTRLPTGSDGRAFEVHNAMSSRFSSSGVSEIEGSLSIGALTGILRLPLASTRNTLHYGRKVRVSGTVSVSEGRLAIYSPVDVDFWAMAALFVDEPIRGEPAPDELTLKGYLVTEVTPGPPKRFSAELIPLGGDFRLLLVAPDGRASNVEIEIGGE